MEGTTVQLIALSSMSAGSIPSEFIRSEKEQPAITTLHGYIPQVPTIDFGDPDEEKLTRLTVEASTQWGMFQIINHGIPGEVISNLQKVGKEFFELPQEEKELYAKRPDSNSIQGYGSKLQKEVEGKKAWVDHLFHVVWPPPSVDYRFWPKNPPSYRYFRLTFLLPLLFFSLSSSFSFFSLPPIFYGIKKILSRLNTK